MVGRLDSGRWKSQELHVFAPEFCRLPSLKLTANAPENRPSQKRKRVFQPSIFRGHVSFRECNYDSIPVTCGLRPFLWFGTSPIPDVINMNGKIRYIRMSFVCLDFNLKCNKKNRLIFFGYQRIFTIQTNVIAHEVVLGLHFARRLNENIGAWTHVLAIGQSATTTEEVGQCPGAGRPFAPVIRGRWSYWSDSDGLSNNWERIIQTCFFMYIRILNKTIIE